jgi:colanic acid/amylovoran biosynthesis glycosyltransferase
MRVGYFINQYPAATHTFIRREIQALEAMGVSTFRYALRSGSYKSVDPEDEVEEKKTKFILQAGFNEILACCLSAVFLKPRSFGEAIREAIRMGRRSKRGVFRHLTYLIEAAVLANWCHQDGIEHIHAHFGTNSAAIAMLATYFSGIPYSFTLHGSEEFDRPESLSLDAKLERAAFVACISSFTRSQLMRWSSPDQWHKISIVHCGLDSFFLDGPVPPPAVEPRLVCVGRLDGSKGQMILIEAARMLHEAGVSCEIVLVGDGPFRERVEAAIAHAGLHNAIRVIGWSSGARVKEEIIAARALILPSFAEGLPVVIMEAMALGRPAISSYLGGIPELIESGETGWLVPASDEIALSEAMRTVLEAPTGELERIGAAARERIVERHDVTKEAAKLKRLFEIHKRPK